ncbi:MAG: glycerate dehydrogenase, partial [Nitrosomonadales bacterium]|nr:glycerate dehydrogenase [Nitrosomonadales bacterium]
MNPPSHIVFLDRGTLPVAMRTPALPLQWREHEATAREQVVERLKDAEVAISNKVPLMVAELAQLPRLRLIAVAATGTNNV